MEKDKNTLGLDLLKIAKNHDIDIKGIDPEQLQMGFEVELEHGSIGGDDINVTGDDLVSTIRIAMAHLREKPDYYTLLKKYVETEKENKMLQENKRFKELAGIKTNEDRTPLMSESFIDNDDYLKKLDKLQENKNSKKEIVKEDEATEDDSAE